MANLMQGKRIGVAMTGSFCTFDLVFSILLTLKNEGAELYPILSNNVYSMDTRFYPAAEVREYLWNICGRDCWHTIQDVEPIGPQKLLDILIVMPCTGNTLAKLAHGISDTPVTMACKSQWRNARPVLLGISTNDGLSGSAANIGSLMTRRNTFFIPFAQDDAAKKPTSLVFDQESALYAVTAALEGRQLQPILL